MNASHRFPSGVRRAGAVAGGLATVIVFSTALDAVMHATGLFPPIGQPMAATRWWLAVGYRFAVTLLGGWTAARFDPDRGMRAAWILTGLGAALGLAGLGVGLAHPELGPLWYAWAVALTGPPASWLGGRLSIHQRKETIP